MINRNLILLIAASLMIAPSANSLFGIDYFRNTDTTTTTTTQFVPQPSESNDAATTQAVKNAFAEDEDLSDDASSITVATTNGVVTLSGTVDSAQEKMDFETTAKSVVGVSKVVNNIAVKTTM